jgi:4-hydroxy-2-oxoheptanedioate aldolase
MRPNRIHQLIGAGRPAIGGWVSSPNPVAGELLGSLGFDTVTIDLQHGLIDLDACFALLHAISATEAAPFVRVSGNHFAEINKVLDAGAYGVICPLVNSAEEASRFVDAVRYPPLGTRSYGPVRGLLYGGADYFERAAENVIALAMVETRQALAAIDAILAVDGLDGIFVGPNDLAISLGLGPGAEWRTGTLAEALTHVVEAARRVGKMTAIWCPNESMAADMMALGFNLVFPGADLVMLRAEAARRLAALRTPNAAPPAVSKAAY